MSELSEHKCEACRADAPRLTASEIKTLLGELPDWQVEAREGVDTLTRTFSFANFVDALAFTQRVGDLAEEYNHHPMLITEWGRVTVVWWTHKIHGLHKNDFVMAAKTNYL